MATNKRKDLGIGTFLDEVKADQTTTQRTSAPDPEPEAAIQHSTGFSLGDIAITS